MENEKTSVGQYLKETLKQSLQVFKTPKKLLPTLVIGVIWLVIGILSSTMKLLRRGRTLWRGAGRSRRHRRQGGGGGVHQLPCAAALR